MSERVKQVPAWLFGLAILVALAFGAQRAMAKPAFESCLNPPYNGGTCTSQQNCGFNCDQIFGPAPDNYTFARCQGGCCECVL